MLREFPRARESSTTSTEASIPFSNPSSSPQPPQYNLIRSLLPTSNPLEQELMVQHPIIYPLLLPMALGSLSLEDLLASRKPGMTATQVDNNTASPSLSEIMLTDDEELGEDDTLLKFCKELLHLTQLHIEYLQKVDITSWIELPVPNQTAVRAIALYLNNDYPVLPLFHADLFLRDLSQKRPYFCSALLISALLGWACQAYASINPETSLWSSLFFLDAQTRWSQLNQDESITISSLSALQFMCMTAITHGQDNLGLEYLRKGLELGQKMGILNIEPDMQSHPPASWLIGYPDWRRAASYAAWGAYNLASMISLHFHKVEVEAAPGIMMPGDIDDVLASEEDESNVPSIHGDVLKASCKLWTIFTPVAKSYYRQGINMSDKAASLDYAEKVYQQLLSWADELPLELVPQDGNSQGIHMLHELSSAPLRTLKADNATPQTRLLLSHRLEMGPEVLSIFWQSCIIYVANAVIHGEDDQEEKQFFIQLCLAGLQELFLSYRISGTIVKGVAAMAIGKGILEQTRASQIRVGLEEIGQRHDLGNEGSEVMASWVLDLDLAVTDLVHAQGGILAKRFDGMGET
ncbi:hypothetical protein BKA59DRAFT_497753 [Fusarium tricinctum]|uniref:Transcription factor domain-containing protein n=1 Tax=Fusarium tricinctum TaxID=61284 RepID=A0A8K0WGB4_9HYPO|nr:hypothetical protein BKA59DRAFT_497753 [Fusarium tricinctum]